MQSARQRLDNRFAAGIGLAVLLFACWQVFNHYILMELLMGRWHMTMLYYHYLSFLGEMLFATLISLFASRVFMEKNRQLENLQQQKDTLVNALVHDLRQPLTAVISGLSGVTKGYQLSDDGIKDLVAIAQDGSAILLQMVNDLLDITRLEAGKPLIEMKPISPASFIMPGVEVLAALAQESGIILQTGFHPDLPKVNGDQERLRRVVFNLVGNAIKYTGRNGTVTITASADRTHDLLHVSVSDTGIGIPPREQQRIFEKFTRVENSNQGRTSTGLGLYFCKLIVNAHGGSIWVESKQDEGATFTFTLPLAKD